MIRKALKISAGFVIILIAAVMVIAPLYLLVWGFSPFGAYSIWIAGAPVIWTLYVLVFGTNR